MWPFTLGVRIAAQAGPVTQSEDIDHREGFVGDMVGAVTAHPTRGRYEFHEVFGVESLMESMEIGSASQSEGGLGIRPERTRPGDFGDIFSAGHPHNTVSIYDDARQQDSTLEKS
jgi:hypothetical protein